jgi:hypothetical protein
MSHPISFNTRNTYRERLSSHSVVGQSAIRDADPIHIGRVQRRKLGLAYDVRLAHGHGESPVEVHDIVPYTAPQLIHDPGEQIFCLSGRQECTSRKHIPRDGF